MPKKSKNSYRELLIKELVRTSKKISEYQKDNEELDPFCKEETYEKWTLEDLEKSVRDDIRLIKDYGENWTLPDNLKYIENAKKERSN